FRADLFRPAQPLSGVLRPLPGRRGGALPRGRGVLRLVRPTPGGGARPLPGADQGGPQPRRGYKAPGDITPVRVRLSSRPAQAPAVSTAAMGFPEFALEPARSCPGCE